MTDAQRFYILSMILITAESQYGAVKAEGIVRVLKAIRNM